MSDFNSDPQVPPPPPPAAPAPPAPGYAPPPGYGSYPQVAAKPPRPAVPIAGYLCLAGGALLILGSVLNWFSIQGEDFNGFSTVGDETKDGPVFVFFGIVAIGAGITFLAARRVLALAIVALVLEVFAMFGAFADLGDVADAKDIAETFDVDFTTGPGLYVVLLGSLIAIAGNIVALAKRRR
jgi:hypothetical protein